MGESSFYSLTGFRSWRVNSCPSPSNKDELIIKSWQSAGGNQQYVVCADRREPGQWMRTIKQITERERPTLCWGGGAALFTAEQVRSLNLTRSIVYVGQTDHWPVEGFVLCSISFFSRALIHSAGHGNSAFNSFCKNISEEAWGPDWKSQMI